MKNMEVLTVSLNCSKGWLSLGRQCDGVKVNLSGTPDNKKAAVLTLNGSLSALNCAVEKVTYNSKPQESGEDEIYVTLSQGLVTDQSVVDDTERDSSYTVSKRMLVAIQAINDPPSISMATSFYAPVGEWVALAGIEIADPDSDDNALYVSIAVQNGRLRVTLPPRVNGGPTALHSTGDDQKLEFATTVEQGKQIFGALEYICDNANSQRDSLTIQVDDNGFTGSRGPQVTTMTAQIIVVQK
ncbi:hypothetical protein PHMEG_0003869 [Phytophthora megakarya]|uniref:Uncharacterized protein n=1 Tax=Phytophthora megakarya TaxID=4795 RepID=A0A225WWT5_9STRA|nr:hypothetical protein PHMEG_0003869 [Phytophthora megakarya]